MQRRGKGKRSHPDFARCVLPICSCALFTNATLDSRSFLNASYRSLLRSYILSPMDASPNAALVALLESPRARGVDLSYLDDASGTSLLHEAARRKNLRLIELAVRAGASVFVRDRRGKMAYEGAGKDDHVRVFLRQCTFFFERSLTHCAQNNDSCKPRYFSH